MHDPVQVFNQAADWHRQGNLAAAERLYLKMLEAQPDHFDALHLLGVLRCQQGRFTEALALIGGARKKNPGFPPVHLNYGLALDALKRREDALSCFDQALALAPDYAEAHYNRGVVLRALDRTVEALASFDRALSIRADYVEALNNRGIVLRDLGRPAEALASFEQALAFRPSFADALNNRGNALQSLDRPLEALASYDAALALQPRNALALNNRGNALRRLRRHEEAIASYDRALEIDRGYADALNNRGIALRELNRLDAALASFDAALAARADFTKALANRGALLQLLSRPAEALECYDKLLALKDDHTEAHYNRGIALRDLRRLPESLASFDRALALRADDADALNNRGLVLRDLERPLEALASFDSALSIAPDNAEMHVNRSCLRLLLGDYESGWEEFEWRWQVAEIARWRREFSKPLWLGDHSLTGKAILLHAEQGLGDAIQFVRYAPLLAAAGAEVLIEAPQPLQDLFAQMPGVSCFAPGEVPEDFDYHCPLLSLPLAFKTTVVTIPATVPYLSVPDQRVTRWNGALAETGRLRVGVVWAGNPMFKNDQTRSVGLGPLLPLLSLPAIDFYSLQKDMRSGDRERLAACAGVMHLGDALADFADTAAVIGALDLVISSDTSVAHLAGALGKPTWILLQHVADWRWLIGREDSPWYPSARLFRQPKDGDWESVVRRVKNELDQYTREPMQI
ncbi:MAG TPA: tetratricopeptide repeat protein [Xanthobacteraceae bacterium]|nr:tetratricopeptide repeat protein [Xanthobacteraceae bacterium]